MSELLKRPKLELGLLALILLLVALRFVALERDPPLYFVGHGQAMLTDPYHLTHHARNSALFEDSHPFDIHRWDSFKHSLISATAYVTFAMFGVSREVANLSATLLQLGGLVFFVLGLAQVRGTREALIAGLFLSANNLLFFYGRLPFLESGLIFLSGFLAFLMFTRAERGRWQFVAGGTVALAALAGKLFGALLLAPALLTLWYIYRKNVLIPGLRLIGGAIAGGALYALVFYGGNMGSVFSYYSEQTVGMYGAPPGLHSVSSFFKMLLTYGGESGFYEYQPLLLLVVGAGLLFVVFTAPERLKFDTRFVPVFFCASWLLVGIVAMSPFFYRPLRYSLFFILPMAALAAIPLGLSFGEKLKFKQFQKWVAPVVVYLVSWYLAVQAAMLFAPVGKKFNSGIDALWLGALCAAVFTVTLWLLTRRGRTLRSNKILIYCVAALAAASTVNQLRYITNGFDYAGTHLKDYNQNLSQMLDSQAVIVGPYAPALTIDNEFRSVIYMFGLSDVQADLFERYPITHVVIDQANMRRARKNFPALEQAEALAELVVRDEAIRLYRVAGDEFPKTDFERAMELYNAGAVDSAYLLLDRFLSEHPENFLVRMTHILSGLRSNRLSETITEIEAYERDNPDDYVIQAFLATMYQIVAGLTKDQQYSARAKEALARALALNPKVPQIRVSR